MIVAGLDFGSNTTLLLIAEVKDGKIQRILCDETRVTKMGQGVHLTKRFHPEALQRIDLALSDYKKLIDHFQPEKTFAVATSAARDVENSDELFSLAKKWGMEIRIISGKEEAALTYAGAFSDKSEKDGCCVIDVGGGSTELIYKENEEVIGESINVGSVRLMDLFGKTDPLSSEDFAEMGEYVRQRLNPRWRTQGFSSAIGVAGTPTILAAMELGLTSFEGKKIDGFVLKKQKLKSWLNRLRKMSLQEREQVQGLPAQRADVIVAGSEILYEFLDQIGLDELEVSIRGVRFGLVLQ